MMVQKSGCSRPMIQYFITHNTVCCVLFCLLLQYISYRTLVLFPISFCHLSYHDGAKIGLFSTHDSVLHYSQHSVLCSVLFATAVYKLQNIGSISYFILPFKLPWRWQVLHSFHVTTECSKASASLLCGEENKYIEFGHLFTSVDMKVTVKEYFCSK